MAAPVTTAIVVVTAAATIHGWLHPPFVERHLLNTARVRHAREWPRLLTSGLLHADVLHLAFNMYALNSFGSALERGLGIPALLLVYLGSILGGSALALLVHRNREYTALGASGGVCGLVFAFLLLFPGGAVTLFPLDIPIPALVFAPLYLLFTLFGLNRRLGRVGHEAHIGGSVAGLLAAAALRPAAVREARGMTLIALGLAAIVLVVGYAGASSRGLRGAGRRLLALPRAMADSVGNARATARERELDELLAKIGREGEGSLSATERRRLLALSKRRQTGRS